MAGGVLIAALELIPVEPVLAIVGVLALLIGGCEWLVAAPRRRRRRTERAVARHRLAGYPPPDVACPWPRLEPELERMREKGAL